MLSDISSESLSKSLSSGKHERFPYFEEIQKSQTGIPIKKKQGGSSLLGFLTIYLIFF